MSEQSIKLEDFQMPKWDVKEDIVISGLAGRFPESESVDEFKKNLFDQVDLVTEDGRRWPPGLWGIPRRQAKLKDISKLDTVYFGVHAKQADQMDPQQRMILELTYEAIVDSGYNPHSLRGKSIGVFIGHSFGETGDSLSLDMEKATGYALTGNCKALIANRVSFCFDLKGPSFSLDTACSSSLYAFQQAVLCMRTNQCEAAIVGGINLTLNPISSLQFSKLSMLSPDGKCKAFDASGDGYVRAEAASVIFLQRASAARRIYATILHSKVNSDGAKAEGVTYPSGAMQKRLLQEVYYEAKIDPRDVAFVEAHGTGTKVGDPEELGAISDVFCKDRTEPLLLGAVKSNMGHSEPASGMCSLAKVIISLEEGIIPPNLHYKNPNPTIKGLVDGSLKVVNKPMPLKPGSIVGLNSFGFGGSNAHVVVKGFTKEKVPPSGDSKIPRLAIFCGRTEDAVSYVLQKIKSESYSNESLVLLEEVSKAPPMGMPYRGYTLLKNNDNEPVNIVERASPNTPPVWFLFSGMGSQWPAMAREMMAIEIFAISIRQSAEILKPYDVDLISLITEGTEEDLRRTTTCFVAIAAVQIALYNLLDDLNIVPDGIVGHSLGETGCAYADGCFNSEQMLLCAYWRGRSCELTNLIPGAMAAVGLTWEEAKKRCPEGVFPACHNGEDSVTISGPVEPLKKFVQVLQSEKIFAREVNSCNIAFHSPYIHPIAGILRGALEKVIPEPKARTKRWVCSSIPKEKWDQPLAQYSSPAYHVNNLTSQVLFHDALCHVPKNAIVIEVAPHGLLQAIVKRTLGPNCTYVSLMKRNHPNNVEHFLSAVGKLYNVGLNPSIRNLYDTVSFPVPRGTPSISSLIKWDHSNSWVTQGIEQFGATRKTSDFSFEINCTDPDSPDYFVLGHRIDGRVLYPATGYLMLAWKALAKQKRLAHTEMPIVFEEVTLHRATIIPKEGMVKFNLCLKDVSGEFQICEGGSVVATGIVYVPEDPSLTLKEQVKRSPLKTINESEFILDSKDFYKELRLRGYDYGPTFQGVIEADSNGLVGKLRWDGNWVSFMDSMLQFPILSMKKRGLYLPTSFQKVKVNPGKQPNQEVVSQITIYNDPWITVCASGAVEIEGLKCNVAPRRQMGKTPPVLEVYQFAPNSDTNVLSEPEVTLIREYTNLCSTLTRQVMETRKFSQSRVFELTNGVGSDNSKNLLNQYLNNEDNRFLLLKVLKDILDSSNNNNEKTNVNISLENIGYSLKKDLLSGSLLNEKSLRASLDLVVENSVNINSLSILEIATNHSISSYVLNNLNVYNTTLDVDYTVGETDEKPIEPSSLSKGVKCVKFNLKSNEDPSKTYDLVLANHFVTENARNNLELKSVLPVMAKVVKDNGFIILIERSTLTPAEKFLSQVADLKWVEIHEKDVEAVCKETGLTIIGMKSDRLTSTLYILRKQILQPDSEVENVVMKIDYNYDTWVESLKKAVHLEETETQTKQKTIWLVANNPTVGIVGLVNCLRREPGERNIRCIFNANFDNISLPEFKLDDTYYSEIVRKGLVMNINRDGKWGSFRHFGIPASIEEMNVPREHAYLKIMTAGDLSSLRWTQSNTNFCAQPEAKNGKNLCHVYYAPLNFRDIMLATGKLSPDAIPGANNDHFLGLEFSGRENTPNGRRIMGFVEAGAIATTVMVSPEVTFEVPDNWTLEEASTVPAVYLTVYYALIVRGGLKRGNSILIHSGSGGVGQAAITVALSMDCEVFTTVGSMEKREYLKKRFPQLKDRNFSNSRDVTFEYDIKRETQGRGVDLVLNSLAEEKLQASVRCLGKHGQFLEIGKFDLSKNNPLGMYAFLKNISFHGILLDALFNDTNKTIEIRKEVVKLVTEGIQNGTVKPLERTIFQWDQIEDAFRYMASGKHMGKVVIKLRGEEPDKNTTPIPMLLPSCPKSFCNPDKTYIIVGGLGGFGLELGAWLIERGCKKLVLTSRTGARTGYQKHCLKKWKDEGTTLEVSTKDVLTKDEAEALIRESSKLGPICGIFNLAVVLRDGLMQNQTLENFNIVTNPKVQGTFNLDKVTRALCPELEWFVTFSSISCGRGNAGQANYGFANSVMERICEQRRKDGLPGLAIQWGVIGDVGIVQESKGGKEISIGGFQAQRINSCLSTLDHFIQISTVNSTDSLTAVVSSFVPAERSTASSDVGKKDILQSVSRILGLKDMGKLNGATTLAELGLDSLMSVEVKQLLERDYELNLSAQELRALNINRLIEIAGNTGTTSTSALLKTSDSKKATKRDEAVKGESDLHKSIMTNIKVPDKLIISLNTFKTPESLFMIHDIEGSSAMLKLIGSSVKMSTIGLQCTESVPVSSIQDLALYYVKQIRNIQPDGPYHICGYSFGGLVAFEMALVLQKQLGTKKGVQTLLFLDGSPDFICVQTKTIAERIKNLEAEGPISVLKIYLQRFTQNNSLELIDNISRQISWEEQLKQATDVLGKSTGIKFNMENLAKAADAYFLKFKAAFYYKPSGKFRGDVTLMKAEEDILMASLLPEDYGLGQMVDGKVDLYSVAGNHRTIVQGNSAKKVAEIINSKIKVISK